MEKESAIEYNEPNSCNTQVITVSTFFVSVTTTGIALSETVYASSLDGTLVAYGTIIGEATGTPFRINFVKNCVVKYTYSYNNSTESLLSFLDIVNNKDGWSFPAQRCVNSTVNN